MELETPRLTLRPLRRRDVGAVYEIQRDREAMRFTWVAPSLAACAERHDAYEALRSTHGFAPWVAVLRADARVVGWGGLCVDPFAPGWGVGVISASSRRGGFSLVGWEPALERNHHEIRRGAAAG